MKRVAIVGIQGVPAKYGGFETLVENIIGDNCSPEVCYTVFCSGKDYDLILTKVPVWNMFLFFMPMAYRVLPTTFYQC